MVEMGFGFRIKKALLYLFLIIGALISIFPFYWMSVIATNAKSAAFRMPPVLIYGDQFMNNFDNVLQRILFFRSMFNSFVVSTSITVSVLLLCSLAGFAFAKYSFKGKSILFVLVVGTLFVPQQLSVLPNYLIMAKFQWIDSYKAIIVPGMVNAFGIFWMRQYIQSAVNNELLEAGRIDGCSHVRIYWNIVVPIIKPAFATLGIFTFLNVWNDFFWPLVVLKNQTNFTIQITLRQLVTIRDGVDYGMIMAATLIATMPLIIMFLMFSNWFITGLTSGAIKE